jgi:hypothetical protein
MVQLSLATLECDANMFRVNYLQVARSKRHCRLARGPHYVASIMSQPYVYSTYSIGTPEMTVLELAFRVNVVEKTVDCSHSARA